MENKSQRIWILLGVLLVIILVVIVAASGGKKNTPAPAASTNQPAAGENTLAPAEETAAPTPVALEGATVVVPGANPISQDNQVVTPAGAPVDNAATPMSPSAPQQTAPIAKETLPASVIKVGVSAAGFDPSEFTVKAGAPITLAISSTDQYTHVFLFDDASLAAVGVGVGPGETRAITFNAPTKAGDYSFRCDVPGHAGRGETGKMIVK